MALRSLLMMLAVLLGACTSSSASDASGEGEESDAGSVVVDADLSAPPDAALSSGSQGCIDGEGLAEGENTFTLDGLDRGFVVRLPNGYTRDREWPLVLALPGNGSGTGYWDATSGNRDIRGELENDAILIIAEAIDLQWKDYTLPSDIQLERLEGELVYFEEVLRQARSALCIEQSAIFAMGFSGGGSFSGVLACRRTDIRAIAVGGSVIYFDEASCVGSAAAWINISSGDLSGAREDYRDFFRERAGCQETSEPAAPDACVSYQGCDSETPVHYCTHTGDHSWPDFASPAMWSFFQQFVAG